MVCDCGSSERQQASARRGGRERPSTQGRPCRAGRRRQAQTCSPAPAPKHVPHPAPTLCARASSAICALNCSTSPLSTPSCSACALCPDSACWITWGVGVQGAGAWAHVAGPSGSAASCAERPGCGCGRRRAVLDSGKRGSAAHAVCRWVVGVWVRRSAVCVSGLHRCHAGPQAVGPSIPQALSAHLDRVVQLPQLRAHGVHGPLDAIQLGCYCAVLSPNHTWTHSRV